MKQLSINLILLFVLTLFSLNGLSQSNETNGGADNSKNKTTDPSAPLFEVKNELQQTVFAVYPTGVKIFIDGQVVGGGFSVVNLATTTTPSVDLFTVNPGSVFVNIPETSEKASGGGFRVGRLGTNKTTGAVGDFFTVNPGSVSVNLPDESLKASGGGFRVGRLGTNKNTEPLKDYFLVTPNQTQVGVLNASASNNNGFSVQQLGTSTTPAEELFTLNTEQTFLGHESGKSITTGVFNTFIGDQSGMYTTTGGSNTFVGQKSGKSNIEGYNNVFVGAGAGENTLGFGNVFLGNNAGADFNGCNALFVDNTSTNSPLIFGDFDRNKVRINGRLGINRDCEYNQFEVEGRVSKTLAGNWYANSDRRIKTEITDITDAFDIIMKLRPVKFKYTEEWKKMHPSIEDKFYYNYIAQEYQNIFPESVSGSGEFLGNDKKEILQIDTYNAQIVSIKAIQDLVSQNSKQQEEINSLKAIVDQLKSEKQALNNKQQTLETRLDAMNNDIVQMKSMINQSGK